MPQESLFASGFGQQLLQSPCGREIAARDWSDTSLGAYEAWPQSLKTTVLTVLSCPKPMLFAWGPELTTFFNDAFAAVFGSKADAAIGKPFRQLWAVIRQDLSSVVDKVLAGTSWAADDMHLVFSREGLPDDSWWSFSISPLWDEGGATAGLLIVTSETTERVLAEQRRSTARERLREALSAGTRIGAWEWDVANDRVYANAQFALIYCVEPERAAAGAPVQDFLGCIHPDDLARVRKEISLARQTGEAYFSEYRIVDPRGENMWVSAQGTPVLNEAGECVRFPGISFDITANKKAEGAY